MLADRGRWPYNGPPMILSFLLKLLFFYFLFFVIRTLYQVYRGYSLIRKEMEKAKKRGGAQSPRGPSPFSQSQQGDRQDVVEAQFRVLEEKDQ